MATDVACCDAVNMVRKKHYDLSSAVGTHTRHDGDGQNQFMEMA